MNRKGTKRKDAKEIDPVNVAIDPSVHDEMKTYVTPKGMKLRFLVSMLWENLKLTPTDRLEAAREITERRLSRN